MQTRFMGISHGSSRQHVTVWAIFGDGRRLGSDPEAVHTGLGCRQSPQHTLSYYLAAPGLILVFIEEQWRRKLLLEMYFVFATYLIRQSHMSWISTSMMTITTVTLRCDGTKGFSSLISLFLPDWALGSLWVLLQEKEAWQWALSSWWSLWPGVHGPGGSGGAGVHELLGPGPLPRRHQAQPLQSQTPHTSFRLLWLPFVARTSRDPEGLYVPLLLGECCLMKMFKDNCWVFVSGSKVRQVRDASARKGGWTFSPPCLRPGHKNDSLSLTAILFVPACHLWHLPLQTVSLWNYTNNPRQQSL